MAEKAPQCIFSSSSYSSYSRQQHHHAPLRHLGPVSLTLDSSFEFGVFNHDHASRGGAFATSAARRSDFQERFSVDDVEVWSLWCVRVRPGHRGRGIAHALLRGAVDYAASQGAPAVEGYPADSGDRRVDTTMAFVGTRKLFEAAGFTKAADTDAVAGGFPRVLMRRALG